MKILVIIPAYNEEENIEAVINDLCEICPSIDYLIVNDCSKDRTEKICKEQEFNYISFPINLGIGGGVQAGYIYAIRNNYDIAIQFDGDGQHNAKYIKNLIDELEKGQADMVIGSRFITNEGFQTSLIRRTGINILKTVIKICTGITIMDTTSGFRATNKRLTKYFSENYAQDYPEPEAIVEAISHGFKIKEIPVVMNERIAGKSSINAMRSIYYMIKVTIAIFIARISIKEKK